MGVAVVSIDSLQLAEINRRFDIIVLYRTDLFL